MDDTLKNKHAQSCYFEEIGIGSVKREDGIFKNSKG